MIRERRGVLQILPLLVLLVVPILVQSGSRLGLGFERTCF